MKTKKYTFKSYFSDYSTTSMEISKKQYDDQVKQLNKEMIFSKQNKDDSMWIEFDCETYEYEEMIVERKFYKNGYVVYELTRYTCKDGYCFK